MQRRLGFSTHRIEKPGAVTRKSGARVPCASPMALYFAAILKGTTAQPYRGTSRYVVENESFFLPNRGNNTVLAAKVDAPGCLAGLVDLAENRIGKLVLHGQITLR